MGQREKKKWGEVLLGTLMPTGGGPRKTKRARGESQVTGRPSAGASVPAYSRVKEKFKGGEGDLDSLPQRRGGGKGERSRRASLWWGCRNQRKGGHVKRWEILHLSSLEKKVLKGM